MPRRLTAATYHRRATRATLDVMQLLEGGRQLGAKARAEGQPRDANPFTKGRRDSLRQGRDRYEAAAMGWDTGWDEGGHTDGV